jgi:hypothetical protein
VDEPNVVGGWTAYLTGRGIPIVLDHVGRSAISSADAKQLLDERREAEARRLEVLQRQEQQAIEQDRARRAHIWTGIPAIDLPYAVSASSAMLAAAHDARPKRTTVLEEALAGESLTYHGYQTSPEDAA